MRESTKKLLISVGSLLMGAIFVVILVDMSPPLLHFHLFFSLALFFISGRFYGAAQGWWEIELRQDWRNTRTWAPKDLVGILLGFGLGMKSDEVEKEGWNPPRKDNM